MEEATDHHPISDQAVCLTELASTLTVNTYAAFHASAISCECRWIVLKNKLRLQAILCKEKSVTEKMLHHGHTPSTNTEKGTNSLQSTGKAVWSNEEAIQERSAIGYILFYKQMKIHA